MAIDGTFFTSQEAADFIGCSHSRVRQMLRDGVIAGQKASERLWLVPVDEAKRIKAEPYRTGRPRKKQKRA